MQCAKLSIVQDKENELSGNNTLCLISFWFFNRIFARNMVYDGRQFLHNCYSQCIAFCFSIDPGILCILVV